MLETGALDGVSAIFGAHVDRRFAVGEVVAQPGPLAAATDSFEITLEGQGRARSEAAPDARSGGRRGSSDHRTADRSLAPSRSGSSGRGHGGLGDRRAGPPTSFRATPSSRARYGRHCRRCASSWLPSCSSWSRTFGRAHRVEGRLEVLRRHPSGDQHGSARRSGRPRPSGACCGARRRGTGSVPSTWAAKTSPSIWSACQAASCASARASLGVWTSARTPLTSTAPKSRSSSVPRCSPSRCAERSATT